MDSDENDFAGEFALLPIIPDDYQHNQDEHGKDENPLILLYINNFKKLAYFF